MEENRADIPELEENRIDIPEPEENRTDIPEAEEARGKHQGETYEKTLRGSLTYIYIIAYARLAD